MSWLTIEGYEGIYAVSDDGEVMSMNYAKSGLPGLMMQTQNKGYSRVFFRKNGSKGRWFMVHTLVATAFIGPRPADKEINHIDGVKSNNHWKNLEYVTKSENRKHAFRLGLQCNKGEQHSQAKLNNVAIVDIRSRLASGETQVSVAKFYEVDSSLISRINSGELWPHVKHDRKVG